MQGSTWSADDIRGNAQIWSLEGDAKLLDFMKNLSKVCKVAFSVSSVIKFEIFNEIYDSSENRRSWQQNYTQFT